MHIGAMLRAQVSKRLGIKVECLQIRGAVGGSGALLSPPTRGARTLTLDTPVEQIVAEPGGLVVLDAHIPTLTRHERYATFKSMSLRQLQSVSQGVITDGDLVKTEADLVTVQCHPVPTDMETFRKDFRTAFGIGSAGASLVRPDGYVAWRSVELPRDPTAELTAALTQAAYAARRS
jgi:putative polyketide hydroxylase